METQSLTVQIETLRVAIQELQAQEAEHQRNLEALEAQLASMLPEGGN